MNKFAEALISERKSDIIPDDLDFFGPFIGEWDFKWHDYIGTENDCVTDGKWTFSRVLEGSAVQDVFVTSKKNLKTGKFVREYGTTVRIYDPQNRNWDIFYVYTGGAVHLVAEKEDEQIVLTCITPTGLYMKWIFYDIEKDTFKWKNIRSSDNGRTWWTKARVEDVHRSHR
ncbi:MAG: hypothetical protein LKI53_09635 [Bacteroidales bacterium]|jgi:hypothetical protein|nr:hypothetical protein [Bacteroidales bacterium]